jgi:hypothetical protein
MKTNFILKLFLRVFVFVLLAFGCASLYAQNCTVNAGLDASYCLNNRPNQNIYFPLNGNSSGNIAIPGNRLWEVVSIPIGANITFSDSSLNSPTVIGLYNSMPTGIYKFRLGLNCQTGNRVYDTVQINIKNVADFVLIQDKPWNLSCENVEDSVHLVARPLKINERLGFGGNGLALYYSNINIPFQTVISGPTIDSVRFTLKKNSFNICNAKGLNINFSIVDGSCSYSGVPLLNHNSNISLGNPKAYISKIGIKK